MVLVIMLISAPRKSDIDPTYPAGSDSCEAPRLHIFAYYKFSKLLLCMFETCVAHLCTCLNHVKLLLVM
jgi:hypothetical protein